MHVRATLIEIFAEIANLDAVFEGFGYSSVFRAFRLGVCESCFTHGCALVAVGFAFRRGERLVSDSNSLATLFPKLAKEFYR